MWNKNGRRTKERKAWHKGKATFTSQTSVRTTLFISRPLSSSFPFPSSSLLFFSVVHHPNFFFATLFFVTIPIFHRYCFLSLFLFQYPYFRHYPHFWHYPYFLLLSPYFHYPYFLSLSLFSVTISIFCHCPCCLSLSLFF